MEIFLTFVFTFEIAQGTLL